jgi:RNA polymerase sigma factor (TIGR02999 family)
MHSDKVDITPIVPAEPGFPTDAAELLPLVYDELRKLAASRLADEKLGHTLQPTALVHEAYLRLVGGDKPQDWNGRWHFFAAAAEAMRRILVDRARHKLTLKAGGGRQQVELDAVDPIFGVTDDRLLALDEALREFEHLAPRKAEVVKLRYFAGLTNQQAAVALDVSVSTVENDWAYARSWLKVAVSGADTD